MICLGDNKMQGLSTQARLWVGILTVLTLSGAAVLTFGEQPLYALAFGVLALLRAGLLLRQLQLRRRFLPEDD